MNPFFITRHDAIKKTLPLLPLMQLFTGEKTTLNVTWLQIIRRLRRFLAFFYADGRQHRNHRLCEAERCHAVESLFRASARIVAVFHAVLGSNASITFDTVSQCWFRSVSTAHKK